jgi:four helix bundle protein
LLRGREDIPEKEFIQFFYIARGSLFEPITALIIFERNKWISHSDLQEMKLLGTEIGKMLISLITSIKKGM